MGQRHFRPPRRLPLRPRPEALDHFPNGEISRRIASAASDVCSGEIIQTQRRFDLKLGVSDYFRIIEMKTAALFAAASELGAFINEASPEIISAMKTFGLRFGTAYQIYDDCLDLAGSEEKAGKTLGTDLRKGKLTLPILHLLQTASSSEHHRYSAMILRSDQEDAHALAEAAQSSGALDFAISTTERMLRDAQHQVTLLPRNRYSESLEGVCLSLVEVIGQFRG